MRNGNGNENGNGTGNGNGYGTEVENGIADWPRSPMGRTSCWLPR